MRIICWAIPKSHASYEASGRRHSGRHAGPFELSSREIATAARLDRL